MAGDLELNQGKWEAGLKKATNNLRNSKSQWDRDLKSGGKAFDALRGNLDGTVKGFVNVRGAIASLLGGAGFVAITKNALNAADAIKDTSERLGLNTTALQRFQYAAKLSALDAESFESAIIKLNSNIAAGKLPYDNAEQALSSLADRIQNAGSQAERAAIANEAFGAKMGAKLIPLLSQGSDGLRKMGDEADRLGLVLSGDVLQGASDFNDQLDTLGLVLSRNFQQGFLSSFVDESGRLRDVYADPQFVDGIKTVAKALGDFVNFILKYLPEATTVLATFAGAASGAAIGGAAGSVVPGIGTAVGAAGGAVTGGVTAFFGAATVTGAGDRTLGGGLAKAAAAAEQEKINKLLEANARILREGATFVKSSGGGMTKSFEEQQRAAEQSQKAIDGILSGLDREIAVNKVNIDLYNDKTGALERGRREAEIMNQIQAQGLKLSESEKQALREKLDLIQEQSETEKRLEEQKKKVEDAERDRQQAMQQFAFSFQSAFEDAIIEGKKLSDVIKSLATDIARLVLRQTITAPLVSGIGDIFSGIKFFANGGTPPVNRLSVVGERGPELIAPKSAMSVIPMGKVGGGSGDVTVNVINNAGSQVKTSQSDGPNGPEITVMIDRAVAENIGRRGSETSRALAQFNGQTLVRR